MPSVDLVIDCPVYKSFRVDQVAGMFDVPLAEKLSQSFHAFVPHENEDWKIGLIVGPSGSGKSTIARHVYGDSLFTAAKWKKGNAVVDNFGDLPIKDITGLLTSVGFSSPPSWVKPFSVLSNGEQFRCQLARALSAGLYGNKPIVVVDEFTSVVDRNVAKIGSAAVANTVRRDGNNFKFVAVTCHYDVADWLEPDWVLDMADTSGENAGLERRRLRRPEIKLEIFRCKRSLWPQFARHHYLSSTISPTSECFVAMWNGELVAFAAVVGVLGRRGLKRIQRIVTLPDYQGVGIGGRFMDGVAHLVAAQDWQMSITASHPSVLSHCKRSALWQATNVSKTGHTKLRMTNSKSSNQSGTIKVSAGRAVVTFRYMPAKSP